MQDIEPQQALDTIDDGQDLFHDAQDDEEPTDEHDSNWHQPGGGEDEYVPDDGNVEAENLEQVLDVLIRSRPRSCRASPLDASFRETAP